MALGRAEQVRELSVTRITLSWFGVKGEKLNTIGLIAHHLLNWTHGIIWFYLTQHFSGHGFFQSYKYNIEMVLLVTCIYCSNILERSSVQVIHFCLKELSMIILALFGSRWQRFKSFSSCCMQFVYNCFVNPLI